jgi:hypothetical protein
MAKPFWNLNTKKVLNKKVRKTMKNTIFIIVATILFAIFSFAQPKTVTDYFLAMPNDIYSSKVDGTKVKGKAAITKLRKSMIKIEDVKNGYLKIEGGWEGWAEIALFKKTDGSYIVAQAESGCGPACDGFVRFWKYSNGKWTNVTKTVFTEPISKAVSKLFNEIKPASDEAADESGMPFYYNLPRQGKIIKVACNECSEVLHGKDDFTIMEFEWNGSKFVKK